ncbi:MAG: helix-turn-helix transcriptional regulator [Clostridia bacterium]|nr:helix-turn-helix transcriptional regulator [Clostridia bacterium]
MKKENNNEILANLKFGQETFSRNIGLSKQVYFGLTYEDITRYTGIPQPTMLSYDKYWVSPYISVAKQIADLYCVDLDTLCQKDIGFYIVEQFQMLKRFIERVGGEYVAVKNRMSDWIDEQSHVEEFGIYEEICNQLQIEIGRLNKEERAVEINRDESVAENFTRNFNNLHKSLGVSYRKISSALDISIGNLTRLKKGGEPMLETVIKLSVFFGVNIEDMIASNPNFNYEHLQQEVGKFNIRFGEFPPEGLYFYAHKRANLLTKEQAKKFVDELLA